MSGPDGIDERFGTLVGELRSEEVAASPELRERVRAIAKREPEPPAITRRLRFGLPRRRIGLVLVPVAAALAAAVGLGAFSSGGSNHPAAGAELQHDKALPARTATSGGAFFQRPGAVPRPPALDTTDQPRPPSRTAHQPHL